MTLALLTHTDIDVQIRNDEGDTALHLAIGDTPLPTGTRKKIITKILQKVKPTEREAFINAQNYEFHCPLHLATLGKGLKGHECKEIILHLIDAVEGLDANLLNCNYMSPLQTAITVENLSDQERLETIDALLTIRNVEVYASSWCCETPLHTALITANLSREMRKEVVLRLIGRMDPGSNLLVKDAKGNSIENLIANPYCLSERGRREVVSKLRKTGIRIDAEEEGPGSVSRGVDLSCSSQDKKTFINHSSRVASGTDEEASSTGSLIEKRKRPSKRAESEITKPRRKTNRKDAEDGGLPASGSVSRHLDSRFQDMESAKASSSIATSGPSRSDRKSSKSKSTAIQECTQMSLGWCEGGNSLNKHCFRKEACEGKTYRKRSKPSVPSGQGTAVGTSGSLRTDSFLYISENYYKTSTAFLRSKSYYFRKPSPAIPADR